MQRVTTLANQLRRIAPGTATVGTLEQINRTAGQTTDTPSGSADTVFVSTLFDDLLGHVDASADSRLPAVVRQLRAWDWLQTDADQDGRYDQPSVAIFNIWWQTLVEQVFGDELPGFDQPVAHISWDALPLTPQVPDTIWMNRGTYNQVVHLGTGRHLWAENVVAPGQSGDPASPHFSDQLALYATWHYKPMRLDLPDLTGHITSTTRLRPPL